MELLRHKDAATRIDFLVHVRDHIRDGAATFNEEITARGARVLQILTPAKSGVVGYLREFARQLETCGKPDIIHIHLNARSGIVALAAWLHRIPRVIVHSHAALTFRGKFLYRLAARAELIASKIIFMFAATDYWGCSAAAITSLFPRLGILMGKRTCVINNAIDMRAYCELASSDVAAVRAEWGLGAGALLVGTVGRLVRHKNVAFLVRVLSVLRGRGVPVTLVIVGREQDKDYASEIRDLVERLGVRDAVVWCGERKDIARVMAACDVFASAALKEGFGLVALEAQAAGTPCVISDGFPDSVNIGSGLVSFMREFEAEAWADEIMRCQGKRLARDESLMREFSNAGFVSAENTKRVEQAYREPGFSPCAGGG